MYNIILQEKVQNFINAHLSSDIHQLALKKNPFPELNYKLLLNQISSKAKAKNKLQTWFHTKGIIYPEKTSIEQTSSELTARYKASIVSGESLVDLTGGFGVDDYFFSSTVKNIVHCEINNELSSIVKNNFEALGVKNCSFSTGDSFSFLKSSTEKFSWIYIDPSRRNTVKGKVFLLADCLPNVPILLDFYFEKTEKILIKLAPILDLTSAVNELKFVKVIHIVSVENEVKELLFELEKNYKGQICIKTIDFSKVIRVFDAYLGEETPNLHFGLPSQFLYEPNSALMKSGNFNLVSSRFNLAKLHPHSHLYTSDVVIEFPGRIFEVIQSFDYNKENLKKHFQHQQCNITIRNFPETVENIRKKFKIKEGGNRYAFFTTDINNKKIVLLCSKIQQL